MFLNYILTGMAIAAAVFNTLGFTEWIPDPVVYGLLLAGLGAAWAFFLLKRDMTPERGTVFSLSAVILTAVQLLGGGAGPGAFLYPLLFMWMRRKAISGPMMISASAVATVEFLAPMAAAAGVYRGQLDPGGLLLELPGAVTATVIPLISLFIVEFLWEENRRAVPVETGKDNNRETAFPEDVARSLIPVMKRSSEAGGIFLFTGDRRGFFTLNEYVSGSSDISSRYMAGPDDPVIRLLDSTEDRVIHSRASRLSLGGTPGLPWYTSPDGERDWISLIQFRRNGKLKGFMVLDFASREHRRAAGPLMVDSGFLVSVAWERSRPLVQDGFLAICNDMSETVDIKTSVHRLISRILATWEGTTASVAIMGEGGVLRVFESLGPLGEGRAGREFSLDDGFAGMAATRREPMRRLRMGIGEKAVRTFGRGDSVDGAAGSCCAVPLEDRGTVIGVLTVESVHEQFFAPEDLLLLKAFATVFNLAAGRRNTQDALKKLRNSDRITGFPLLSSFYDNLNDLVRGVRKRAWSITVLAVDICDLSSINEGFGYEAGDEVLKTTAERLERAVGKNAVFTRCGADDFLVCLPEVDRVSAEAYAARIHEEFEEAPVIAAGREIPVSVCIGGAVSHVDRMIVRLPSIAGELVRGIQGKPGMTTVTEVGQFYGKDR